jgi:hypothetical protein
MMQLNGFRALATSKLKIGLLALATSATLITAGCGMGISAPDGKGLNTMSSFEGTVYGGHQPIGGATVNLYAAGTGGYGLGSTLLAQTTTDTVGTGIFTFSQVPTQPGTLGNTYACPTASTEIYITVVGGDPRGGDVTGNVQSNSAILLLAGIGQCSSVPAFVNVNEAQSVASIFALAQYINPDTSAGVKIGTSSTPQGILGLQNAFAIIPQLVPYATGTPNATFTPTSTVSGVTMTGTPESGKIGFIANIMASCVDEYTSACTTLFAATPPPSAALTSQPSATFNAATNTLQAVYYMAINPVNSGTQIAAASCVFNTSATSNLNCLYSAPAATGAPFPSTGFSSQPSDWTVSVAYTSSGTCNTQAYFGSMEWIAIVAGGNVWFNNGASGAVNNLGQLSPTGGALVCAFGNITAGRGLTIDTAGNVWSSGSNTTSSVYEYLTGGTTLNWTTTVAAGGIVADGSGNVFYVPTSSATSMQEYVGASSASVAAAGVSVGAAIASLSGDLFVAADPSGNIWSPAASGASIYELYPGGATPTGGYTQANPGTALTTSLVNNAYGAAIDSSGNLYGGSTCCSGAPANTLFKATPTGVGTVSAVISAKFAGGVVAPRSVAVDGAGNIWVGMGYPVYTAATSPTGVAIYALAEVDKNLNSISYTGPNGATGPATCSSTGTNCPTSGGFQKTILGTVRAIAVDPSGNVWAPSSGTVQSMVEFVGAAVPVVTPLSIGAKNSTLGTKP